MAADTRKKYTLLMVQGPLCRLFARFLTCEDATRLSSHALDRELTRREKFLLWAHNRVCGPCHTYSDQIGTLHEACRCHGEQLTDRPQPGCPDMDEEKRARMKERLRAG